jgi:hypothetical protein
MKYAEQILLKALTKAEVEFLGQSSIDDIVKVMEDYANEMKVKNLSSNTMLADSFCECDYPNVDSRDTFSRCNNCHRQVDSFKNLR